MKFIGSETWQILSHKLEQKIGSIEQIAVGQFLSYHDTTAALVAIMRGLQHIADDLSTLHAKVDLTMTTAKQLQDDIDAIGGDMAAIKTGVANLQTQNQQLLLQISDLNATIAKLEAGEPVTQEQLDVLVTTGDALRATADATAASIANIGSPAPTPTSEPTPVPTSDPAASDPGTVPAPSAPGDAPIDPVPAAVPTPGTEAGTATTPPPETV